MTVRSLQRKGQAQSTSEAERQKQYHDRKANAISLEPDATWSWLKPNAYKGKRKVKDWWEEDPYKVECWVAEGVPSYCVKNQQAGCSWVFHWNWLFLITPTSGTPPLYSCGGWVGKVHHHHTRGTNSRRNWDWGSATKWELSATGPATDSWDSSRLDKQEALGIPCGHFLEHPCWIKGKKFDVEGSGVCAEVNASAFWLEAEVLITLVRLEGYDQPW